MIKRNRTAATNFGLTNYYTNMKINIPDEIVARLTQETSGLNTTVEERIIDLLNRNLAPEKNFDKNYIQEGLDDLKTLLTKIPCIEFVATSKVGEPFWWLKFNIDINSKIAWSVVQELGHILNYLSSNDKLPTTFYPVSPPPYLNGGPKEFLSWVIEPVIPYVDSNNIYAYLVGRFPEDYNKEESWLLDT
jgi:hypothetical protein